MNEMEQDGKGKKKSRRNLPPPLIPHTHSRTRSTDGRLGLVADFDTDANLLEFMEHRGRREYLGRLTPFLEDASCVSYRVPDPALLRTDPKAELPKGEAEPSVLDSIAPAASMHHPAAPAAAAGGGGGGKRRRLLRRGA